MSRSTQWSRRRATPLSHLRIASRLQFAALTLALAACAGSDAGGDAARAPTVRDSAGVQIVENTRPAWTEAAGWRVDDVPSLSIGAEDGDSALLLSRVNGATRLSDGRIVIADGGSSQLRFFDSTGRFLSSTGREGEGPGEFQFLNRVWRRPGDTLAVTDIRPRVSYFDPQGNYLGAVTIAPSEEIRRASIAGQANDGAFLGMSGSRGFGAADQGTVIGDTIRIVRYAADGATASPLGRFPGQERWGLNAGGRITFPFLPFSSPSSYAAGADRFAAGSGRTGEVTVWRSDGSVTTIVRWPAERRPVTRELLARYREDRLTGQSDPNERRRLEQFLADAPVADTLPVYQALLIDDLGHLWVEEYRPSWEPQPVWQVFAPDGRWLGAVRTPPRFRVFQIGEDFVLGRWLDDSDVEHVRLHRLVKRR